MGTTLRGMGADKKILVLAIFKTFGYRVFTYREVSALPEFDHATFFRLYADKMILWASKSKPLRYRLGTQYSRRTRGFEPVLPSGPSCQVDSQNVVYISGQRCQVEGGRPCNYDALSQLQRSGKRQLNSLAAAGISE